MNSNLAVTQSHPDLMRRHYPREFDGAKNEWRAMIDHDREADTLKHKQLDYMKNFKQKLQGDNLLCQMKYKNDKNKRLNEYNVNEEREIIEADNMRAKYEEMERKKLQKMQQNLLYTSNKELEESRKRRNNYDQYNYKHQEQKLIDLELKRQDPNVVRSLESKNLAKQCALDNLKIQGIRTSNDPYTNYVNSVRQSQESVLGKGDLFDSIYTRQKQWQNFYKICTNDQYNKIQQYKDYIDDEHNKKQELHNRLKGQNQNETAPPEPEPISNDRLAKMRQQDQLQKMYNQQLNVAKDSVRMGAMDWNKSMQEVREPALRAQNLLQSSMDNIRHEKEDKYRDILSQQVDLKQRQAMQRYRMTDNNKLMNYEDLQAWKEYEPNLHNSSLPGSRIDNNVASAVLNKFSSMNDIGINPSDEYLYADTKPGIPREDAKNLEESLNITGNNQMTLAQDQTKDKSRYSPMAESVNKEAEFINKMSRELHNDSNMNHK